MVTVAVVMDDESEAKKDCIQNKVTAEETEVTAVRLEKVEIIGTVPIIIIPVTNVRWPKGREMLENEM